MQKQTHEDILQTKLGGGWKFRHMSLGVQNFKPGLGAPKLTIIPS